MKQTFPEHAEMRGKCPVMQQKRQWSLTVYASSKSLNVCSILPGKDRLCRVIPTMNQTLFTPSSFKMVREERRQIHLTRHLK